MPFQNLLVDNTLLMNVSHSCERQDHPRKGGSFTDFSFRPDAIAVDVRLTGTRSDTNGDRFLGVLAACLSALNGGTAVALNFTY